MVGGEISTGLQIKIVVSVFMCMLTVDSWGGRCRGRERLSPDEYECGAETGHWRLESLSTGVRIIQGRNEEHSRDKNSDPRQ